MALIHESIINLLAKADAISKDRRNQQQGFNFRGIDDVYNALHPLLAECGVFSTTKVLSERSEERQTKSGSNLIYRILTIEYTFYAADGSSVSEIVIGEGMDSGDKASNKAMAVAHKYALLQLLAIPTEDEKDPDAQSHDVVPAKKENTTLNAQNPIGKPPEQGMKEQALALLEKLGLDEKVKQGMMIAHGGKVVENNGKKVWQGINWVDVLAELKARESASGGTEFADDVPWTVPAGVAQ